MIKEFLYYSFKQVYPRLKISDARNSYDLYLEEDDMWIRFSDNNRVKVPYEHCCYVREKENGQLMSGYFNFYLQDTSRKEMQRCLDYLVDMYSLRKPPMLPQDFDFLNSYNRELREYLDRNKPEITYDEMWEKWIVLLLEYKEEYGTLDVPKNAEYKGQRLGAKVERIRKYYNSGDYRLNEERINQLKAIGFVFDSREDKWNKRFALYKEYVEVSGSFVVPRRMVYKGDNIGAWKMTQKLRYKQGKISEDRIAELLSFDPSFFQ